MNLASAACCSLLITMATSNPSPSKQISNNSENSINVRMSRLWWHLQRKKIKCPKAMNNELTKRGDCKTSKWLKTTLQRLTKNSLRSVSESVGASSAQTPKASDSSLCGWQHWSNLANPAHQEHTCQKKVHLFGAWKVIGCFSKSCISQFSRNEVQQTMTSACISHPWVLSRGDHGDHDSVPSAAARKAASTSLKMRPQIHKTRQIHLQTDWVTYVETLNLQCCMFFHIFFHCWGIP